MSQASFADSLRAQYHSINAIVLRDMHTRFARSRFGYMIAMFEPVIMIVTIYVMRRYLRGATETHGIPVAVFLTTGYLVHYAFRHMVSEIAGAVQQTTHLLSLANVTVLDNILGRAVSVWMTYTSVNIILSTMAVVVTHAPPPYSMLLILYGFYGAMWAGFAFGILLGTGIRFVPSIRYFVSPLMRFSMFFSGAMFSAEEMPKWLLPYVSWNPVFHGTEILREGWTATYHSPVADLMFLFLCCTFGTALALLVERVTRHFKLT